ncbi:MAG: CYTH domain-containing protein [Clostridia bacterium]
MKKEIELKFKLNQMPILKGVPVCIIQTYFDFNKKQEQLSTIFKGINFEEIKEARVRKTVKLGQVKYTVTLKSSGTLTRSEYEKQISYSFARGLLLGSTIFTIIKQRYIVKVDKYKVEIDKFLNTTQPLVLAEVEFNRDINDKDIADVKAKLECAFLLECEDVTNDSKYKNKNLKNMVKENENENANECQ